MARLEAGVYAHMAAAAGLTALISTKIYPVQIGQNIALPAVTYFRVSTLRHSVFMDDPDLSEARVQISSWSTVYSTCQNVAEQVRLAWTRYTGTTGGVTFEDTWPEDETTLYDPETETYQIAIDVMMTHRESTS